MTPTMTTRLAALALPLVLAASAQAAPPLDTTSPPEIFGYVPFWTASASRADWRWERLNTVAFFSAELSSSGHVTAWHDFKGPTGAELIADAHAHDVRVVLVATAFDATTIHGVCGAGKATAISELVDAVVTMGADGINLDFESAAAADRAALTAFAADLTAELRAVLPEAQVSLALPVIDWREAYDEAALADILDVVFVMAYDYHWRGGDPGPVAPLVSSERWGQYSVRASFEALIEQVGPANRHKLVMGNPLYGYDWPSVSDEVPGERRANATAVLWRDAEDKAAMYGRQWDDAAKVPYYLYQDEGGWRQVFYDDAESLGAKLDLAHELGIGGSGVWALGYQSESFWDTLDAHAPAVDAVVFDETFVWKGDGEEEPDHDGLASGCGCHVGGRAGGPGRTAAWPLLALALAGLWLSRRSRS
jgi:spore germination protein